MIFDLGAFKAPGPDGFKGIFFQKNWNVIKGEIINVVTGFFRQASIPDTLNTADIALVPKVENPKDVTQFRPISCTNFAFKIISKVLAGRVKSVLKDIVGEEQSAFISGRQIQDNITIAHEVFHVLKAKRKRRKPIVAVKLDWNKAYDRLEWMFLRKVLIAFGFNEVWTRLVMAIVTSTAYRVKINGRAGRTAHPKNGVR